MQSREIVKRIREVSRLCRKKIIFIVLLSTRSGSLKVFTAGARNNLGSHVKNRFILVIARILLHLWEAFFPEHISRDVGKIQSTYGTRKTSHSRHEVIRLSLSSSSWSAVPV